ncbi:MAG: efflux RND transporter permease subunit, partial [Chlamydiae bacterium]|nr:efflux RND transporter permease subunit [Chlamydiota bacterium]
FLEGFLGKIFIEFAWTLAFCVLFSGFVSLTLTPMMCSKMMGDRILSKPKILQNFDIYFELTQNLYINLLKKALGNKKTFFAFSSLSIVVLIAGFYFTGKTFVPDEDQAFLRVSFSGPEGSSLKETEKSVIAAEEVMKKDKDIQGYFIAIGSGGSENAMAFVPLTAWSDRKRSQLDIQQDLNKKFAEIPGMSIFAMNPSSFGFGGSGFDVEFSILSSLDYDKLDILSKKFISSMEKASIFTNIDRDFKASTPTIDILIHKDKAYKYGASLENIGTTIQYLITGKIVGDFMMGNDIYNVLLQSNALLRKDPANLRGILIQTNDNSFIPLSNFAALKEKISV